MAYATVNPYTNELVASFPASTDDEITAALDRASAAFRTWSTTPLDQRRAVFRRAGELLVERSEELARLNTLEMGKLYSESLNEIRDIVGEMITWLETHAEDILRPRPIAVSGADQEILTTYEPQGIVFAIEPWNVPFYQAFRGFGPAAIGGNVVILKHASNVPQCADALVQLFYDAGLPEGVWQNVYATHDQVSRIIADRRVRMVTLTGSAAAGSLVAAQAGKALRKTVLELGGTDAFVVLPDADLDLTLSCALSGRFWVSGQICVSAKRMIVVDPLYDEFLARYASSLSVLHPGDPFDPTTTLAPLSSQAQADTVKAQIEAAVAGGATATVVGDPVPSTGAFVQPTILTDMTPDNPVFHEEIFGPVPIIFRVPDVESAIALANDSWYGLAGSVWSRDVSRATEVARRIDTGMVAINQPYGVASDLAFGGVKDSGYGREMGYEGVREFYNHKMITLPVGVHADYATAEDLAAAGD